MITIAVLLATVALINGQYRPYSRYNPQIPPEELRPVPPPEVARGYRGQYNPYYDETPKPYSFSYVAPLEDGGQSSRTESGDGSGRVEGSYTLTNDLGHTRLVEYVADEGGFRASVQTNEPGTDNKNPADVVMLSAGPYSDIPVDPNYRGNYRRPVVPAVNALVDPAVAPVVDEHRDVIPAPRPGVPTWNRGYPNRGVYPGYDDYRNRRPYGGGYRNPYGRY